MNLIIDLAVGLQEFAMVIVVGFILVFLILWLMGRKTYQIEE